MSMSLVSRWTVCARSERMSQTSEWRATDMADTTPTQPEETGGDGDWRQEAERCTVETSSSTESTSCTQTQSTSPPTTTYTIHNVWLPISVLCDERRGNEDRRWRDARWRPVALLRAPVVHRPDQSQRSVRIKQPQEFLKRPLVAEILHILWWGILFWGNPVYWCSVWE